MKMPKHIAIIMDGNGRWAHEHGVSRIKGHRAGVQALERTVDTALELGVEYLTVYAFSVDNWKRSTEEVDSLMNLLREFLKKQTKILKKKNVKVIIIGRKERLASDIIEKISKIEKETSNNKKLKVIIAFNYGARAEIVDAVKNISKDIVDNKIKLESINEELFSKYLYTKDIPDPDLFIRTSGEMRISNYLLWQLSYTELWITSVYWPDFDKKHLLEAIEVYNRRERRFGGRVG